MVISGVLDDLASSPVTAALGNYSGFWLENEWVSFLGRISSTTILSYAAVSCANGARIRMSFSALAKRRFSQLLARWLQPKICIRRVWCMDPPIQKIKTV